MNSSLLTASLALLSLSFLTANAYEERSLLQKAAPSAKIPALITTGKSWIPYPAYADRAGWDKLMGDKKKQLIRQGEKQLNYDWKVIKATDYLEFERSGNRDVMQNPYGANNKALQALVLAELAEGKGRFMDQIANGIFHSCEMTSWSLSAHLKVQKNRRPLPMEDDQIVDLTSGELASMLAWTHYFLKDELSRVHPAIPERLNKEIHRRIIDPYMERAFGWSGLNRPKGAFVNNWNPWCNSNVLQCLLLLEDNPETLAQGIARTMDSVDKFIDYNHDDGACEEGPSYWTHAAGKMYDYLTILHMATQGKINLFDQPLIRNMGEYIARSYIGDGWVVNFADASPKGGGDASLIFRFGQAVKSPVMTGYAAAMEERQPSRAPGGLDMFRALETLRYQEDLAQAKPSLDNPDFSWYPETEFCYMSHKNNGLFVAAKGGFNAESHNHNDVGTFSVYARNVPMIVDAGVGTYTRQTFSGERYSIWTMQSDYHNVPKINGVSQKDGSQYKAMGTKFDPGTMTFSTDLAKAYPDKAGVKNWNRSLQLSDKGLTLKEKFSLNSAPTPQILNFLTWAEPDTGTPGKVILQKNGQTLTISYDTGELAPSVEKIPLDDKKLSKVWGDSLYRLSLTGKKMPQEGSYTIHFQ